MARVIAGQGAASALLERARRIAEAQIDLLRVRRARYALLADPKARRKAPTPAQVVRACGRFLRGRAMDAADLAVLLALKTEDEPGAPPSLAEGFEALAAQLGRLDRYERRALSRRKFAIREFDRARADRRGARLSVVMRRNAPGAEVAVEQSLRARRCARRFRIAC